MESARRTDQTGATVSYPMMATRVAERILVDYLVRNFERCLTEFERRNPFSDRQFRLHEKTIALRANHDSARRALADDDFLKSLHDTLAAWLGRAASLRETHDFETAIRARSNVIAALDKHTIDSTNSETLEMLWLLIRRLEITDNETKLVASTKALHHLLPQLVVPINRTYTAPFLLRCQQEHFQNLAAEKKTFTLAFNVFSVVAKATDPGQYVNRGCKWNTSATKVIDNAIVGLMRWQMSLD